MCWVPQAQPWERWTIPLNVRSRARKPHDTRLRRAPSLIFWLVYLFCASAARCASCARCAVVTGREVRSECDSPLPTPEMRGGTLRLRVLVDLRTYASPTQVRRDSARAEDRAPSEPAPKRAPSPTQFAHNVMILSRCGIPLTTTNPNTQRHTHTHTHTHTQSPSPTHTHTRTHACTHTPRG